jgi:hypothetical protein
MRPSSQQATSLGRARAVNSGYPVSFGLLSNFCTALAAREDLPSRLDGRPEHYEAMQLAMQRITRSGGAGFLRSCLLAEAGRDRLEGGSTPYAPGNRGLSLKVKRPIREEFVGWAGPIPKAPRPWLGALLLAYYDPDGRLVYARRAGTMRSLNVRGAVSKRWRRPLCRSKYRRPGAPLVLSRVHCRLARCAGGFRQDEGLEFRPARTSDAKR